MEKKFLFFDMDGTLIPKKTTDLLPSTIEAINKAKANGHYVFLCTGRGLAMAKEYQNVVDIPGIIYCNGGGIYYEGKVIEKYDMDFDLIVPLTMVIDSLNGGYLVLNEDHCYYNEKEGERFANMLMSRYHLSREECFEKRGLVSINQYDSKPVQKIDFNFDTELIADIFFSRIPEELSIVTNGGYYANMGRKAGEMMAPGVTKGSTIRRVVEIFGGTLEDAYGFGDSTNDLEMFEICGTAIAMGNASDAVKAKADYVTDDCNSDGIYNAMKHFGLI